MCGLLTDCGLSTAVVGRSQTFMNFQMGLKWRNLDTSLTVFSWKSDILTSYEQQPVAQQQRRIRFSTAGTVRDSEMVVYMTEGQKGNAERETSLNLWICFTCNMIKALKKLVSLSFIHNLMIGDLFFHHLFFSITFLFEYTFTWFVHVHCLCHLSRWRAFLECCCSLRRGESRERTYYATMFAFK